MSNNYAMMLKTPCKTTWTVGPSAAWKRKQLHSVEQRQDVISPMWFVNLPPQCLLRNSHIQCENNNDLNKVPLLIQLHWTLIEFIIADKKNIVRARISLFGINYLLLVISFQSYLFKP